MQEETSLIAEGTEERMIRPGGTELTDRGLQMAGLLPGSTVYDIGCGSGETVRHLLTLGYDASGIDLQIGCMETANLFQADAAQMPFASSSADGLLFECSYTKMKKPERVLSEAFRVLRNDGRLIVADMVARGGEAEFSGYIGRMISEEHLKEELDAGGFQVRCAEACDCLTKGFLGNLILNHGCEEAERLLGGSLAEIRKTSPGYVILVLTKRMRNASFSPEKQFFPDVQHSM